MLNKPNSLFNKFQIIVLQLILHVQYRLHLFVSLLTNLEKKRDRGLLSFILFNKKFIVNFVMNITKQKCPEKDGHCADAMIQSEIISKVDYREK